MSPRKVRLVVDAIRGMSVTAAETKLTFLPKLAATPVHKLLRSAIANADHNFHLKQEDLYIKTIVADGGPTLKRSRARAFGRAAPIRKRTTHITLVLSDEKPVAKAKKSKKVIKTAATKKSVKAPKSEVTA
jgi:large subunit ribosomal protein L22